MYFQGLVSKECLDIFKRGINQDGVYTIYPNTTDGIQVYCEMAKGGWTRIMNRIDNGTAFNRSWNDFKIGFGDINGNHWLGFNSISKILSLGKLMIRFEFMSQSSPLDFFEFDQIMIASESLKYKMILGTLTNHNIMADFWFNNASNFYTYDNDRSRCAHDYKGGWWHNSCYRWSLTASPDAPIGHLFESGKSWKFYQNFKILLKNIN